jgi:hypothetical protein
MRSERKPAVYAGTVLKSSGRVLVNMYDFASRLTHTGFGWTAFSRLDPNVLNSSNGVWQL